MESVRILAYNARTKFTSDSEPVGGHKRIGRHSNKASYVGLGAPRQAVSSSLGCASRCTLGLIKLRFDISNFFHLPQTCATARNFRESS